LPLDDSIEKGDTINQSPEWDAPGRIVASRQKINEGPKPAGKMLSLLEDMPQYYIYRFKVYVANIMYWG